MLTEVILETSKTDGEDSKWKDADRWVNIYAASTYRQQSCNPSRQFLGVNIAGQFMWQE